MATFYQLHNTGTRKGTVHILPSHRETTLCGHITYKKTVNNAGGNKISQITTLKPVYQHTNPCLKCLKQFHKQYDDTLQLVTTKSSSKYHIHPAHLTESLCGRIQFTTNTDFTINQRNVKTHRFIGLTFKLYGDLDSDDANLHICRDCRATYHNEYPLDERGKDMLDELNYDEYLRAKYRVDGVNKDAT